jgi:hypothetical protein
MDDGANSIGSYLDVMGFRKKCPSGSTGGKSVYRRVLG